MERSPVYPVFALFRGDIMTASVTLLCPRRQIDHVYLGVASRHSHLLRPNLNIDCKTLRLTTSAYAVRSGPSFSIVRSCARIANPMSKAGVRPR